MCLRTSRRSALTAAAAVAAFALVFVAGHYLCYGALPDARLSRFYFMLTALGGGVPTFLKLYRLGLLFIAGASAGWIVDCAVTMAQDPLRPTMQAGMYNAFITLGFALIAVIAEIRFRLRQHKSQDETS